MRRLLAIIATSALVFAGCNSGGSGPDASEDPKAALVAGFKALGDGGLTATLRLDTTVEDLMVMNEESGDSLTEEQAQQFIDSSLQFTTNGETEPEKSQFEMIANVAGLENAVEVKYRDDTLYARASVRDLTEEFGGNTAELDMAASQAPPGFDFIGPAIEGEWIGITGFQALSEQLGAMAGAPQAEEQQEQAQQMMSEMAAVLENNAEVTHEGSDDAGDHLVASVNARQVYGEFVEALGTLGGLASAQMAQLPPESEIPDEDMTFDAWVSDGQLSQLLFDFTQFGDWEGADMPEGLERFGLLVEMEEFDGEIEVPEDVTNVDVQQLMQTFMGGMGIGSDTMVPETEVPADFCEQLKEAPEDVQAQFEAECPELAD